MLGPVLVWALLAVAPRAAHSGVEDWELNEVHRQSQSDSQIRFVELVNLVGGCLFPSSTLNLYSADGTLLDIIPLAQVTTCHAAPTYFLLATTQASSFFGVSADLGQLSELPSSGQLCFASSSTLYDCVRWGTVTSPLVDLFGNTDTTVALEPPNNFSLNREQTTHVVVNDWAVLAPTPRAPNDGSTWDPPDAGPLPDAAPFADAGVLADAAERTDAGRADARPDARNTRYLDLDAVGGGDCGCQQTGRTSAWGYGFLFALILLLRFFPVAAAPRRRG